jgi:hypothetical protein
MTRRTWKRTELFPVDRLPRKIGRNQRAIQTFLASAKPSVRVTRTHQKPRNLYKSLWDTINTFGYDKVVLVKMVDGDVFLVRVGEEL